MVDHGQSVVSYRARRRIRSADRNAPAESSKLPDEIANLIIQQVTDQLRKANLLDKPGYPGTGYPVAGSEATLGKQDTPVGGKEHLHGNQIDGGTVDDQSTLKDNRSTALPESGSPVVNPVNYYCFNCRKSGHSTYWCRRANGRRLTFRDGFRAEQFQAFLKQKAKDDEQTRAARETERRRLQECRDAETRLTSNSWKREDLAIKEARAQAVEAREERWRREDYQLEDHYDREDRQKREDNEEKLKLMRSL